MTTPGATRPGHAIVIGGSMAGLLAARVLADHCDRVTILERDVLPDGPVQRRGVPQGRHTHGLIAAGGQVLERLFPGFTASLREAGGLPIDPVRDIRWFFEGGRLAPSTSGIDGVVVSRPLLEAAVRTRVVGVPAVTIRWNSQARALTTDGGGSRVTGVRLEDGTTIRADLVVDASGRGSHAPQWLSAIGFPAPAEDRVGIGLSYTTRIFRREGWHADGDLGIIVPPTPSGKCGGVMLAQEGDRWTVTLMSHFGPPAGESIDTFREFARQLPAPDIHGVIRSAEPLGEAFIARFPASVRRRYERLARFPEGFVVVGDALCSFNPIYGQGMSVAALQAEALGEAVAAGMTRLGPRFFRMTVPIVDNPWTTAVANDLRMPETQGPRSAIGNAISRYIATLHRAAHQDPQLAVAFLKVANLLASPGSLMTPRVIVRTLLRPRFVGSRTPQGRPLRGTASEPL